MKLVIKSTCVVSGGKILERGAKYEPASEGEAFDLIAASRAVSAASTEAAQIEKAVAEEKLAKAK